MDAEEHIKNFNDWSFSQGRPKFADDWGIEEHTRFCIDFLKQQLLGNHGITGPIAVFSGKLREIVGSDILNIDFYMAYYVYMNMWGRLNDGALEPLDLSSSICTDNGQRDIEIDIDKIRKIMVLA